MGNSDPMPEGDTQPGNKPAESYACPSCGYDLRGLSTFCTCPECGFECDPEAMIVKFSPRQWRLKQVVLGMLLITLAVWAGRPAGAIVEDELPFWILVGGATVYYFLTFCSKSGEHSRLLLTRRGIRFEDRKLDRGWTEWSLVKRARYSWLAQRLYVISVDNRKLYSTHWRQLGSPARARECLHAINRQLWRYAQRRG